MTFYRSVIRNLISSQRKVPTHYHNNRIEPSNKTKNRFVQYIMNKEFPRLHTIIRSRETDEQVKTWEFLRIIDFLRSLRKTKRLLNWIN